MEFQKRYENHQKRKKEVLELLLQENHSTRVFANTPLPADIISFFLKNGNKCPNSCDRQAITIRAIQDKDLKNLLGGLLVGGVGWIHRAPVIFLFFAYKNAYKGIQEVTYMPYLDTGVVAMHFYTMSCLSGLFGCFVNPNIREYNQNHFYLMFSPSAEMLFTGAFALGEKKE